MLGKTRKSIDLQGNLFSPIIADTKDAYVGYGSKAGAVGDVSGVSLYNDQSAQNTLEAIYVTSICLHSTVDDIISIGWSPVNFTLAANNSGNNLNLNQGSSKRSGIVMEELDTFANIDGNHTTLLAYPVLAGVMTEVPMPHPIKLNAGLQLAAFHQTVNIPLKAFFWWLERKRIAE